MSDNLATALAEFQRRLPRVDKSGRATVPTKTGGSYTYTYAGLDALSEVALPLLGEVGLAFLSRPTLVEGRFVLAYSLLHASGGREDGEYPLPAGGTPQEIGSAITYGRRYSLCAVTGIAPSGEDDDGRAATVAARRPPNEYTVNRPPVDERRAALNELGAKLNEAGILDRDLMLSYVQETLGRAIDSSEDLTADEVRKVLDRLVEEAGLGDDEAPP